jgi:Alpha/beta hydrolase domain
MHSRLRLLWAVLVLPLVLPPARAELIDLQVLHREPFLDGKPFGDVGPYEKVVAIGRFAIDPKNERNRVIVDLDLAPRNADGKVEFEADVFILTPKDPSRGNGALLYDVNNRGNKLAVGMFNRGGGGNDPGEGDGFLFRRGYTVVWSGWVGELLPGNGRLLLHAPVATEDGKPIRGVVRYETETDAPADSLPLSRRDGHGSYPPTEKGEKEGVLTWRMRETDERVVIPRDQWSLERLLVPKVDEGVPGTLGQVRLKVAGGFRPGYLYELVCEAEGPIVQGVGFAGVRDVVSFLKYDTGKSNPLRRGDGKPAVDRAHGFGVSQSGRFLRHFLYLGFNADERGRKVFDGLMPHVAGGGLGFFDHRFAQPTRHNAQHEEHAYPTDVFPFTYGDAEDPFSHRSDGLLKRLAAEDRKLLPKVMHTQSAAEYWHRSGSLVHTDPKGEKDAEVPPEVRVYAFGGTQHGPAADPPGRGIADNLHNPGDYRPQLKALLDALDLWVREGKDPPPSVYPRIDQGTLVGWRQKDTGFPSLPGVRYPEVIQQPEARNYGPDFLIRGIITVEPPEVLGRYGVRVPKSDADGNDVGCLLPPEVGVPLATYTGWNLRSRSAGAEGVLVSLTGSFIPFPRTAQERKATGDPRRAVQERYQGYDDFVRQFGEYGERLVKERYLLREDADRLLKEREGQQKLFEEGKR